MPMSTFDEVGFPGGWVIDRSSSAASGSLIDLTNCFVTPEGIIKSRSGAFRINVSAINDGAGTPSTQVHSLAYHGASAYYGVGTAIKRGTTTNIVTGLASGTRTTFARMSPSPAASDKEFTYFANPTATGTHGAGTGDPRKKDDGTNTYNWGMNGPTASAVAAITPTVSSNQPATTAIDSFASAYTAQDGFGSEGAATNAYATSARAFTVPATKIERFRRTGLTLDLSTQGQNGFIRIMLRVDNRQNLDHVEVAFSTDGGTFANDYYTTRIRALEFTADNTWQEFKIRKPDFQRVKTTGGSSDTWANVDGVQVTVGANSKGQVAVSADDARVEADTHVEGRVDYRVTLWNDTLKLRSNARRLADVYTVAEYTTAEVTAKRQRVTIARPSDSATWDPTASHWELWRRNKDVSGDFFFVARIENGITSYNDDIADIDLGEALIEDNHIPPAAQWAIEYDESMFLFGLNQGTSGSGIEESSAAVRWSRRRFPESFPLHQYLIAGDPADPIQGGCLWAGGIQIFTRAKIRMLSGSGGTYTVRETEAPIGTPSGFSIASSPQGVFYRAFDGIYLFTGNTSQKVSQAIDPIFHGESTVLDGVTVYPIDLTFSALNVIGTYGAGHYIFVYTDTNGSRTTLYYEVVTQRWSRHLNNTANSGWDIAGLVWAKTDTAGFTFNDAPVRAGTGDGWIVRVPVGELGAFQATDPGSASIAFAVQLKAWDKELKPSEIETDLKDLAIDINTGGQTLTVQVSFDGAAYTTIGTVNTAARDKVFLPINNGIGTIAYKCAVRISGTLSTARVSLYSVGTQHIPEPKRVIDTSTDFDQVGWPGEKLLQAIQITANTFGVDVVVTVEADGVDLGQTFTLNTSVRRPTNFAFTIENPRATNLRLKFNGSAEWKLYSYQFKVLNEPLRVTILETEASDEGWPGEKLLQELQIEANTFGADVTVTVEADGVNLGQTFTLNTSVHKPVVFSFNISNPRATLLRLKMVGSTPWLYYKHRFQYLQEPLTITKLETAVSDEGWPGEKILQELQITANTHGGNVTIVVEIDGVDLSPPFILNTSAHRDQVFSFPIENPRATNLRLKMTGAAVWVYYKHQFQYLKEPLSITKLETEITDEGWPAEKIFQELQITANTHGEDVAVVVEIDGVDLGQTFTLNTEAHRDRVFSFNIENPRGSYVRLKMTGATSWLYYKHKFQYLQEPLSITKLETAVSDEGWPGEKILQELQITANTHGLDVAVVVEVDGTNLSQTFTLNTTAHRDQVFSFNTPHPRGTNIRLKMTGTQLWLYYKHQFQYLKEPLRITKIQTEVSYDGWSGPKLYRQLNIDIDTNGRNVTGDVLIDGVIAQTHTINTTNRTTVTIAMESTPEGRTSAIRLTGQLDPSLGQVGPFLYYSHDWIGNVNLPNGVVFWESTPIALWDGKKGWLGPRAQFMVRGTGTIIITIYMDSAVKATLTITGLDFRRAVLVALPIGVIGKLARITLSSPAPFQIFPEGSFIESHQLDGDRAVQQWKFAA